MCDEQLGTTDKGWAICATPSFSKTRAEYRKKRSKHRYIDWSIDELRKDLNKGLYGDSLGLTNSGGALHKPRIPRKKAGKRYGYRAIIIVYKNNRKIKLVALYDKREISDIPNTMYDDIRKNF